MNILEIARGGGSDAGELLVSLDEANALTGVPVSSEEDVEALLVLHVQQTVDAGKVTEARELIRLLDEAGALPASLRAWRDALRAPEARRAGEGRSTNPAANLEWLRQHARRHQGFWVALTDGSLVDRDRDRRALHGRLSRQGRLQGVTFFKVPE